MDALRQLKINLARSPAYEAEGDDVRPAPDPPVRLFAFYLPQFHPIPENDEWWGKGFTEWTNVTKALPRFEGHYQPRLPSDLGYYDLRLPETIRQQVALAKRYGVAGFCFHWYWFGGRRLLERPLQIFLEQKDLDFPFFINWANENWTRRWDGHEQHVLLAQRYSEDDDLAIADDFLELMKDGRYLRVEGRPVLMLYRPSILPDAKATIERWRARFAERGENDPLILMPQTFDTLDPRPFGMDAAVQFPPHHAGAGLADPQRALRFFDHSTGGGQHDYQEVADRAIARTGDGYVLLRGVCPSWDNEARKPNSGSSLVGATPARYGHWLARAIRATQRENPPQLNLVFVNAWNEWAEGAHLEPDRHYGHAYLRETCRVLAAARSSEALERYLAGKQALTVSDVSQPDELRPDTAGHSFTKDSLVAERYDGHVDDPFEVAGIMRAWLPRNVRVLDVGCGTGSLTEVVNSGKGNEVICIEPDAVRAERAQARNFQVHCGQLDEDFVRRHESFDVVILSDVVEHLPDPAPMLGLVSKTLKPGGQLFLSVPNVAHWSVRLSLLFGRFEYEPTGIRDATHLRWFTAKTIQSLVRDSGFKVLEVAQSAGQELPDYHRAPWNWLPPRIRRKMTKLATRAMPHLFGCQHVLRCELAVPRISTSSAGRVSSEHSLSAQQATA